MMRTNCLRPSDETARRSALLFCDPRNCAFKGHEANQSDLYGGTGVTRYSSCGGLRQSTAPKRAWPSSVYPMLTVFSL